jgi:hypothetical protein
MEGLERTAEVGEGAGGGGGESTMLFWEKKE